MNRSRSMSILIVVALIASLFAMVLPAGAQTGIQVTLNLGPRNADQGETFTLPLNVTTATGFAGLRAYQFRLQFDPSRVQVNSVTDGGFLQTAGASCSVIPALPPVIDNVAGTVNVPGWAIMGCPGSAAAGTGALANISFTVRNTAPNGQAPLTLSNVILADINANGVPAAAISVNSTYIQVGPGPDTRVASLGFQPIGTGSSFDVLFTITNQGGTASTNDVVRVNSTGTTTPTQDINIGPLAAGASQSFTLTNYSLATGFQFASFTVQIQSNLQSRTATYAPVSSSGQTPVDASFGAFLQITPPTNVNFGQLQLGANSVNGTLNVRCNTNYAVDLFDNGTTAWRMTEWNGTVFGTRRLSEYLFVQSGGDAGSHQVSFGTAPRLVDGGVVGQTGDTGQNFGLTFNQTLRYSDPLLPTGSSYHMILTFNGYVTL